MYKMFSVIINDKEYDVYRIDEKSHDGTEKNWWIYYSDKLPDGIIPAVDSDYLEPWHPWIPRHSWDINFKQNTTSRRKDGELRYSNHTFCEMWYNKRLVYKFDVFGGSEGMNFAMSKANNLQVILREHSYHFLWPEQMQGRKICYYGLPATIEVNSNETWKMRIIPDYSLIDKESWWKGYKNKISKFVVDENWAYMEEDWIIQYMEDDYINIVDILEAENIYWHR